MFESMKPPRIACNLGTFFAAGTFSLTFSTSVVGQIAGGFTREEFLMLPRYCQAQRFMQRDSPVQTVPASEHATWKATLGPGFEHMHHYCAALIFVRRASAAGTSREKNFNYREAIANFRYVQNNVTDDFALLPEICLRKGFAHLLLGEKVEGAKEFTKSMRLKRDYTPGYGALIDYFIQLGELEEAERVLNQGLEHAPSSRLLQQKREELDALRKR